MKRKMSKDFSAKDQLRRAAISVSNNIAEGFEYNDNRAFMRFLMYTEGSAGEVRSLTLTPTHNLQISNPPISQLYVLKEAGMIEEHSFNPLWESALGLSRHIEGFRKYLRTRTKSPNRQSSNL